MTAYFRFVLSHRLAVGLVCLLITALSVAAFSTGVIASSIKKMFFGDSPRYAAYQARAKRFGSDEMFIVAFPQIDPLAVANLDRLARVVARLEAFPEVARVHSLLTAQRIWSDEDSLRVESYADAARSDPDRRSSLLDRLTSDKRHSGVVISRDGKHMAALVELAVDPTRRAEGVPKLVERVMDQFRRCGYSRAQLHLTGIPPLMSSIISETYVNLERLFPLSGLALLITVLVVFRRLAPALLASGIALIADAWALGFSRLLDREFNILVSMVPAVILVVSYSDVIHLWSAFQIELKSGKDRNEAILASATDVGTACLLTSATTFVGFLALSLVPTPMFRQMGLVLGFGVAVALLLAMTLVPLALSVLPIGRTAAPPSPLMGRFLERLASGCSRRPGAICGLFALGLAGSIAGLTQLHIDTDMPERLSEGSRFRQDQRYFTRHFAGTTSVEVFVDTRRREGLLEPAVLRGIDTLERRLAARPEVDHTVSLVTLMRALHQAIAGKDGLPDTRQALAQYLLLFEISGGEHLEQMVDFKRRTMRIVVRTNSNAVRATHETGLAINRMGHQLLDGRASVESSGIAFLLGWWLDAIVAGQRNGLLLSFAVIALMMAIGLRSVRVGLLSMLPNLLPLLALGGFVGAIFRPTDSDTMGIAVIALGIGVDDTIHFLMRYRIESGRTASRDEAIRRTFAFSGRAIILTTVVLVAGFLPFATSDYFTTWMTGTLLPGALVVALLADLLLVPAMVQLGLLAFDRRGGGG